MFPTGVGMNRVEDVPPLLAFYVPYRRGDKSVSNIYPIKLFAPRAGAWIETKSQSLRGIYLNVAPRAGAWIETSHRPQTLKMVRSLPARERGLKQEIGNQTSGVKSQLKNRFH